MDKCEFQLNFGLLLYFIGVGQNYRVYKVGVERYKKRLEI